MGRILINSEAGNDFVAVLRPQPDEVVIRKSYLLSASASCRLGLPLSYASCRRWVCAPVRRLANVSQTAAQEQETEGMKFSSSTKEGSADSRPAARRWPCPRTFRPVVEWLEGRIVPSTIDHLAGFANHGDLQSNGSALFSASVARLTDGGPGEAGSIFTSTRVNITEFTIGFTFVQAMGTNPTGGGFTFTIQNDPRGSAAVGPQGSGLGYGPDTPGGPPGILNSVAIKFDLHDNFENGASTGLFTAGRSPTVREAGLSSQFPDLSFPLDGTGIDLHSQDLFQATLTYDGSSLSETIQDTSTGATFTASYAVNIVALVGSTAAYVGFTGGSGDSTAVQDIESWAGVFGGQPTLTSFLPDVFTEGAGANATLTVSGANLLSDATVLWQGTALATTQASKATRSTASR
jgi:hypothetical protein